MGENLTMGHSHSRGQIFDYATNSIRVSETRDCEQSHRITAGCECLASRLVADARVTDPEVGDESQDSGEDEEVVDPAFALVVAHRVGFGICGVVADAEFGTDIPGAIALELAFVAAASDLVAEGDGVLLPGVPSTGGEVAGVRGADRDGRFCLGPCCGFFSKGSHSERSAPDSMT